jgi:hypothetical protein
MKVRRSATLERILKDPEARKQYEFALQTDRSEVLIRVGGETYRLVRVGSEMDPRKRQTSK